MFAKHLPNLSKGFREMPLIVIVSDSPPEVVPLCSVYNARWDELNWTVFEHAMYYDKQHAPISQLWQRLYASKVKACPFGVTMPSQPNGVVVVSLSEIFITRNSFLPTGTDNIWQTVIIRLLVTSCDVNDVVLTLTKVRLQSKWRLTSAVI